MESTPSLNGVYSADKIKKYWKNQQPHNGEGNYVDPVFSPSVNSILAKDSQGRFIDAVDGEKKAEDINANDIEWLRAGDIFGKFLLFDQKIECNDIKQGNLGNCYFLSALAALTEFPQLIYQIFRTKEVSPNGYYELVLFIDGEWVVVPLDDYLPVKKGTKNLSFAKPNGNELWVILLEKAWAKVNGGYANIISGWPSDALATLTGFSNQKLILKDLNKDYLWEVLKTSDQSDNIMCTSTKSDKNIEELGLVVNHAYTLVGAKETLFNGVPLKLVHIRNPWGHKEWLGDWSDNDTKWTPELNDYFNHKSDDDGTFFMTLDDFTKVFDSTHICHVMYDSNIKSFKVKSENIAKPQVFNFYLQETTKVSISVITKHWRFNREMKNVVHPFSLVIARFNTKTKSFLDVDGEYSAYENLEFAKTLTKGLYAVWVYCAYDQSKYPKPEDYIVRFASSTDYKVRSEGMDHGFDLIKEMIIAGVKENFESQIKASEQYYGIENQFKRTGLGYRCVINKSGTVHQRWTNDATGIQNMCMLPPYCGKDNFEFLVPPKGAGICLGIKTEQYGSYWFNLKSQYFTSTCNEGQDPTNTKTINYETYINCEVAFEETDEGYYDYISSSLSSAKKDLQFSHINTKEVAFEELKNTHPDLISHIQDLASHEDESLLTWGKLNYDNGFYIGQYNSNNSRNGRGVYFWTYDKIAFAGYWTNNVRDKWGKLLDRNSKVTYEGAYSKGLKHGRGKLYFSNGDHFDGLFFEDKRHGHGVYVWADGSKWTGNFENNQMNGKGIYDANDGSQPWEVEYQNGQCV